MKRVAVFIGLKMVEIVGVFGGWWLMCLIGQPIDKWICKTNPNALMPFWACGFHPTLIVFVLVLVGMFFYANWKWAGRLSARKNH